MEPKDFEKLHEKTMAICQRATQICYDRIMDMKATISISELEKLMYIVRESWFMGGSEFDFQELDPDRLSALTQSDAYGDDEDDDEDDDDLEEEEDDGPPHPLR